MIWRSLSRGLRCRAWCKATGQDGASAVGRDGARAASRGWRKGGGPGAIPRRPALGCGSTRGLFFALALTVEDFRAYILREFYGLVERYRADGLRTGDTGCV